MGLIYRQTVGKARETSRKLGRRKTASKEKSRTLALTLISREIWLKIKHRHPRFAFERSTYPHVGWNNSSCLAFRVASRSFIHEEINILFFRGFNIAYRPRACVSFRSGSIFREPGFYHGAIKTRAHSADYFPSFRSNRRKCKKKKKEKEREERKNFAPKRTPDASGENLVR